MERNVADVRSWVEENDAHLYRAFPLEIEEVRDSKNGIPGSYAIKGLASVYNKRSLNLGGFRERVLPGAFDRVLSEEPHVIHTWDHDTSKSLSSTRSSKFPLELKSIPNKGLGFYSRVAPTTYAHDLRLLIEGDVINQSSFAFTVRDAEWRFVEDEDMLERDVKEVEGLFDVTTCAMGAYPQTESEIAVRSLLRDVKRTGTQVWIPSNVTATTTAHTTSFGTRASGAEGNADQPADGPAPDKPEAPPAVEPAAQDDPGAGDPPADDPQTPTQVADEEARKRELDLFKQKVAAKHRSLREFVYRVDDYTEES